MKKKRFFYAVVSFMHKGNDFKVTRRVISSTEKKYYPVFDVVSNAEELFADICEPESVLVETLFEISEKDFNALLERDKKKGFANTVYENRDRVEG